MEGASTATPDLAIEAEAPESERLSLGVKLAYGMPGFAGAGMLIPILIHMPKFYSDVVLVPLGYIALWVALARAFDAIFDPLMGWISDRTQTRWGRRRPWIVVGAPLCALAFVALFSPPESLSGSAAALWFGVSFVLWFLFHSIYVIPHAALGPELTLDYHERSTLFGWREGFVAIGTLIAAGAPGLLAPLLGGDRAVFRALALGFATLLVVLYFWLVARVRERPDFVARESNPLVPGVRVALRNRPFRILLLTYVVASIPGAIPGTLMPYFNAYVIQPENPDVWLARFLGAYFGAGFLFLPAWLWAARRFGKKPVWLASFFMGTTGGAAMFLLGPGDTLPLLALITWSGTSFGGGLFLTPAIQADVIDYDELHTGKRREAQYMGLWSIVPKFVVIPSAALPLAVLAGLGYVPNQPQSPTVVLAIKSIFALAPAFFSVLAFFIAWRFPITESVHRAVLLGIEKHRRGEWAEDPLTGARLMPPASRPVDRETSWYLDHFSRGELERLRDHGPARLMRDIAFAAGVSLGICALSALWLLNEVEDLRANPGPLASIAVVVSGFALTAFLFHVIRMVAARHLRARAIGDETLRAHLEEAHPVG
jgi:GPH family glycoside/pentoside/hexuronide:cation symporter